MVALSAIHVEVLPFYVASAPAECLLKSGNLIWVYEAVIMAIEKPFSKQRWRFFDLGLFIHIAQRVAQDVKTVEYFTPWEEPFSKPHKKKLGKGVPGITRWDYFFEDIEDVDCFVFPDVGYGDIIDDLRARGKRVFGCGLRAQTIEADRFELRRMLKSRGLPVAPHKEVIGFDPLVEYLKKHPDVWVKINNDSRGIKETFHVSTYDKAKTDLHKFAAALDCFANEQIYLVEQPSHPDDGVEMGDEQYFNGTKPLSIAQQGCEVKGVCYGGIFLPYDQLSPGVKAVSDATWPFQRRGGLQGIRSTEIRFGKKETGGKLTGYYSDACQRYGCPPSGTSTRGYKNITEMIYRVAGGEDVTPDPVADCCAELIVWADAVNDTAVPFEIKDKDFDRVLVRQFYKNSVDGMFYRIPHNDGKLVAECIGFGKTMEEAQAEALKSVDLIKFDGKQYQVDAFDQLNKKLAEAKKMNIWPG
jgi:hypothetical protein